MELIRRRSAVIGFIAITSVISMTLACNARNTGYGWGEPGALIISKPTLIPKLFDAFQDGKASVKPIKPGKFFNHGNGGGKGFGKSHAFQNGLGHGHGNNYEYGYGVNAPYTNDFKNVYEKGNGHGVKGHYSVKEPHSYTNMNYDTSGGHGGHPGNPFGDYGSGFVKK